jgi:hypothetical protein
MKLALALCFVSATFRLYAFSLSRSACLPRVTPTPPPSPRAQLPGAVQSPSLDASRYDRAIAHPRLQSLAARVNADQSRQRDRDRLTGSASASASATAPASSPRAIGGSGGGIMQIADRDMGRDAARAARSSVHAAAATVSGMGSRSFWGVCNISIRTSPRPQFAWPVQPSHQALSSRTN